MSFNKGYELKKFEAHWEKLRIEYAAAGMTEDAIQKMYDYDRQQFNSERTFVERTQEFTAPAYESSEENLKSTQYGNCAARSRSFTSLIYRRNFYFFSRLRKDCI